MSEIIAKNTPQFVSDVVGRAYEQWLVGDVVKITAPTGSGKSYFILHTLLKHAIKKNKKILYLVNRRILKKQLEEEIKGKIQYELRKELKWNIQVSAYIEIATYQYFENSLKSGTLNSGILDYPDKYDYVVYDECHYFYSDSTFNTNTELSYDFLRKIFYGCVEIFMSATMEHMQKIIDERKAVSMYPLRDACTINVKNALRHASSSTEDFCNFIVPINYDYVKLHIFEDDNNLIDMVLQSHRTGEKWLIFVDYIPRGKELEKKITTKSTFGYSKEDVVFIDAGYEQDIYALRAVEELSSDKLIKKSVIITTAVMDNGISFQDAALRNIVIMADVEEEFIQMLGRKRQDGKTVNLFICKRDSNYFLRRKKAVEGALELYDCYRKDIYGMYWNSMDINHGLDHMENGNVIKLFTPAQCVSEPIVRNSVVQRVNRQQKMLNDMIANTYIYENIKKFCYFVNGIAAFNSFSIERLYNLQDFYSEMEQELKENEFAFVERQAKWLSCSEKEVEKSIEAFYADANEKWREVIKEKLEKLFNKSESISLTTSECVALKRDNEQNITRTPFFEAMIYFYELCYLPESDMESLADFKKNDRPFKEKSFNSCMKLANLPYWMRIPEKKGRYMIERILE